MEMDKATGPLHLFGAILAGAMAIFMVNLDATVVNIVLPELCGKFHISTAKASLVVLSYLLALTSTSLMFGRLSDMKGPERIFFVGYLVFSLGSGLCALAWDVWSLAAFRFVQGGGGAMIFATSAVIVMRYVPAHLRGRAYAVNGMMAGIGFALGSPIGAFLSHHFDWRAVFLVNIPVGLAGLMLCLKFLTRRDHNASKVLFDKQGAVLSFLALATIVYTLHSVSEHSFFSLQTLGGIVLAFLLGALFVRIEKRLENPLLKLCIFKNRLLIFALAGTACYYVILQGTSLMFPFYLIQARGLTEIQSGNLLFAGPLVTIVLGPAAGWLCDKVGPKLPCLAGAVLFIASTVFFLHFDNTTSTMTILAGLILLGVGMSLYSAPILMLTMTHAEPETLGILSSLKAVLPSIVGLVGVGVFAAIYSFSSQSSVLAPKLASQAGFHQVMYVAMGVAALCLVCTLLTRRASAGEGGRHKPDADSALRSRTELHR